MPQSFTLEAVDHKLLLHLPVCPFLGQPLDKMYLHREPPAVDSATCSGEERRWHPTVKIVSQPDTGRDQKLGNGGGVGVIEGNGPSLTILKGSCFSWGDRVL